MGFWGFGVLGFWGLYTVSGKSSTSPITDTAINFIRASLFAVLLLILSIQYLNLSLQGVLLAVASGTLASGAGYTLWYGVLKHISVTQASVLQLSVPIIAAIGGVIFTNEPFTIRFLIASIAILGGILLVLLSKHIHINKSYP